MRRACASLAISLLLSGASGAATPARPVIRALSVPLPTPAKYFPQSPGAQAQWSSYLVSLGDYQKSYPGLFTPLDLVRWDKLPDEWLKTQIRKHGLAWQHLEAKTLEFKERRSERLALSRRANQELFDAEKALEKQRRLWMGATRAQLDTLKPEDRFSLTPLDEAFQRSDLGKQLSQRFGGKNPGMITGFLVDPANKTLIIETGENDYFKTVFDDSNATALHVRAFWGRDERLGTDVTMLKENFRGFLLNPQSGERLPLGPYPAKANLWVDERGTSHFKGDGHKH
ncbi:MAG: hypothetical protein ABIR96_12560 [Bdellovibrionota bacterium]